MNTIVSKILFAITVMFCLVNIGNAQNNISVEPLNIKPGASAVLNIDMSNSVDICSFQFNIKLPDGVTVVDELNEDEELVEAIFLTSRKKSSHDLSFKKTEDGNYFLLAYSLSNATFHDNNGAIVTMKVKADEKITEGKKEVLISNAFLVTPNEDKIQLNNITGYIIISQDGCGDNSGDSYDDNIENKDNGENATEVVDNAFYIPTTTLSAGTQQTLYINLKNSNEITAFQLDLTLPAGIAINTILNDDGEQVLDIQLTSRKKSKHQLSYTQQDNGTYRIIAISTSNQDFRDNDGAIIAINVTPSSTMSSGSYYAKLSNIHIVPLTNGEPGIRIDQPDLVHSIYVDNQGSEDMPSGSNTITVETLSIRPGNTGVLNINMTNEDDVCSFQFNIKLPEGISIIKEYNEDDEYVESINLTNRKKSSHELSFKQTEEGDYFLIAYSLNNSTFSNNSGAIVSIRVKADGGMSEGDYGVILSRTIMVTPDERKIEQDDYYGTLIVTSEDGIENITAESDIKISLVGTTIIVEGLSNTGRTDIYNLCGQKVASVNGNGNTINIDCSQYQSQTLIVRVIDKQKNMKIAKFYL